MKTESIRKKDLKELTADLLVKEKELVTLKFDLKIAKEKDYSRVKKLKKQVAVIKTIINEVRAINLVPISDKIDETKNNN
jgi:ribosomal protein L29